MPAGAVGLKNLQGFFPFFREKKIYREKPPSAVRLKTSKQNKILCRVDPSTFVDHYETALVDMLQAKQGGRVIEAPKEEPAPHRVINLMDALRASIGADTKKKPAAASSKARAGAGRTAKRKTGR
jgi:DNA end-binding protein Ku